DLRLFRDQQMVGYEPKSSAESLIADKPAKDADEELQRWRHATELKLDANGKARKTFFVKLPQVKDPKQVEFSAYAFNVDRVKSATDRQAYALQPGKSEPAKGRAYLITVGVNVFESPLVRGLLYPANDARLIRDTLSEMLGQSYQQIVALPLIADLANRAGENVIQPTKDHFKAVLELLSGKEVKPERLKNFPPEI